MLVPPISFKANFNFHVGDSSGIDKEQMLKEINTANTARNSGVSVPQYQIGIQYKTNGEIANYPNNKITKEHLRSLFKNIYLLDTLNISHNDLDIGHVFYSKNGEVELDCFRFSSPFTNNNEKLYNLPSFMMPTNQVNYENAGLCFYVEQIPTKEEKINFLKAYLKESHTYHRNKANYATEHQDKFSPEMIKYETILAETLENPDNKMAELMLDKLDFLIKQRRAFTEWDEGNGACGHPFNKERRLNSIPMYFESIKSAINYSQKAQELSLNEDGNKAKYYEYEAKIGEYFANMYISWVSGMANYNFEDTRVTPLPEKERNELKEQYSKIINADFDKKEDEINSYLEMYKSKI